MFILDKRSFVRIEGLYPPASYDFVIKEMCRAPIPTILVTLNDRFFGQYDSLREAQDDIDYFALEENMIEVVF